MIILSCQAGHVPVYRMWLPFIYMQIHRGPIQQSPTGLHACRTSHVIDLPTGSQHAYVAASCCAITIIVMVALPLPSDTPYQVAHHPVQE